MTHYTVSSMEEAWKKVQEIFPTDYQKDEQSSERAGYPIYRSTAEDHWYDHISDLTARLEVNIGSDSINIWIEAEATVKVEAQKPVDESHIEVEVTAVKSGEKRLFKSYEDFIRDHRFFCSSGVRYEGKFGYETEEDHFEAICNTLRQFNHHGMSMGTCRSGLEITFIYFRWPEYDRHMNRK